VSNCSWTSQMVRAGRNWLTEASSVFALMPLLRFRHSDNGTDDCNRLPTSQNRFSFCHHFQNLQDLVHLRDGLCVCLYPVIFQAVPRQPVHFVPSHTNFL
jgi:hypothetical protein